MRPLSRVTPLDALRLEGPVTVFRPKGERFYHVFFRARGKQFNRSTGKTDHAEAEARAAEIFAEVIRAPIEAEKDRVLNELMEQHKAAIEALNNATARITTLGVPSNGAAPVIVSKPRQCRVQLATAIKEFLADKKQTASFHHFEALTIRTRVFMRFCEGKGLQYLADIEPSHCHEWISTKQIANKTRRG